MGQMNEAGLSILVLAVVVLLPLIPAYVLFKYLPSTGSASGPFQGLTLKFGGAFAGYLVIFSALLAVRPTEFSHYHTWEVSGRLSFNRPPSAAEPDVNDIIVRIVPPDLVVRNQGLFRFRIPVEEDAQGKPQFPDLQIDLGGYRGATIPLGPDRPYGAPDLEATHDFAHRTIVLNSVTLQSLEAAPSYAAEAAEVAVPVK
jgi:hypothetical protein